MSWLSFLLPCCPLASGALLFGKGAYTCDEAEMNHVLRIPSTVSKMPLLAQLSGLASFGNAKNSSEIS